MTLKNNGAITRISSHTIKKFELVDSYIKSWAQKLIHNNYCKGLLYIDCMCNSGVYMTKTGEIIYGTALLVAKTLSNVASENPNKSVVMVLNDLDPQKIKLLKENLPTETTNFHILVSNIDANVLLKQISPYLDNKFKDFSYFLFYDPYDATIKWDVLMPYFRSWGEVLINHMVMDPVRAIKSVKSKTAIEKYESTYLDDIKNLIPFGSDQAAYEKRVAEIINNLKGERKYFVASFPFFNKTNALLYDLILCTGHIKGFNLYKKCAWKIFNGQSSDKKINKSCVQLQMDLANNCELTEKSDEYCYQLHDIEKYIHDYFEGQEKVPLGDVWKLLEVHPVFPADGYRKEIKKGLVDKFNAKIYHEKNQKTGKKETYISFEK